MNWEVDEVKVLTVSGSRHIGKKRSDKHTWEENVRRPIRWLANPEGEMAVRIGLLGENCDNDEIVENFDCPFYQG